jgi:hypothetical protein
MHTL